MAVGQGRGEADDGASVADAALHVQREPDTDQRSWCVQVERARQR